MSLHTHPSVRDAFEREQVGDPTILGGRILDQHSLPVVIKSERG